MGRSKTDSCTLGLRLLSHKSHNDILNKRLNCGRILYNKTADFANKQLKLIQSDENYIKIIEDIKEKKDEYSKQSHILDGLQNQESNEALKQKKIVNKAKKEMNKAYKEKDKIVKDYNLDENSLQKHLKDNRYKYQKHVDSNCGQKIASQIFQAVESILDGDGKAIQYKKYGTMMSMEGKDHTMSMRLKKVTGKDIKSFEKKLNKKNPKRKQTNRFHGMKLNDWYMIWGDLIIPVYLDPNDTYAIESLETMNIKYCRILKKIVHGKDVFYIQAILEGTPIIKKNKKNKPFHPLYVYKNPLDNIKTPVGIDIGTSTIAICSLKELYYDVLAPNIDDISKPLARALRKLDRSRRLHNKDNFNENGTIKKLDKYVWVKTKNYMKTLYEVKELYRIAAAKRKERHCKLANYILTLGNIVYIEKMNFKALQKRAKKTEISEKTNRFKKKKRFGKSLLSHAPAKFVDILKYKMKYNGMELKFVNTYTFKASKFIHTDGSFEDVELNERWKNISNKVVNRDLYSSFLIMNSLPNLKFTDVKKCNEFFDKFLRMHNKLIKQMKMNGRTYPKCVGLNDIDNNLKLIKKKNQSSELKKGLISKLPLTVSYVFYK